MNPYKEVRLIGKLEDGDYLGRIEQIGIGTYHMLYISNRHDNLWIFSLLTGYRQIGCFKISLPYDLKEGDDVMVSVLGGKIVGVHK